MGLLLAVLLTGCGSDPVLNNMPAASSVPAPLATFDQIDGQFPPQPPDVPGAQSAPVGACVSLTGPQSNPSLAVVDCGSELNGYRVIQRVHTPDQCVKDADQRFYLNPEEGQWTACLDYAWSDKDCLSISDITAIRARCDDTTVKRDKPMKVLVNSISTAGCPDGGFAHPIRRFTICTQVQ
ncbi:LppU/SCO3897 family protein [Mycolicibacterium sp. 22603]|uniref:LppU/SCO3897 family protein n=1 Tax=Mycolicibacterium sp. 22603 TaxID=3453950 RepID=UPI003F86B074